MKRRKTGNYMKKYPHLYEAFRKEIKRKHIAQGIAGCFMGVLAIFFLFFLVIGHKDEIIFFGMLLLIDTLGILLVVGTGRKINEEELLLMDKDFAGSVREVKGFGYQTEESLIIGLYRMPVKGLKSVSYDKTPMGRSGLVRIDLDFEYEGGEHRKAELIKEPEIGEDEKLKDFIRNDHTEIKVYKRSGAV